MVEKEKHPVIFGSCTFSDTESCYSQPKLELYGVFRAVKDLWHRIWGIHIRIDVDAKFLIEMVKQPDLPNAPMTRWISYIALFDYEICHVPAQSHAAVDGLSRRKHTPKDSEDEDAEDFLGKFIGSAQVETSLSSSSLANFLSSQSLLAFRPTRLDKTFFQDLLLTMRRTPRTPYASFCTTSVMDDLSILNVVDPMPPWAAELQRIRQAHYDPSMKDSRDDHLLSIPFFP